MTDLRSSSVGELEESKSSLEERYRDFKSRNLRLDMTRGKPCSDQLDLSLEMLECVNREHYSTLAGEDCRNYGGLDGIPEAKELFSQYLEVEPTEIITGGNSSLNMMHDTVLSAMVHGVAQGDTPWGKLPSIKFLCPSPGYDRHFSICEYLQIEMVTLELGQEGPSMDEIETMLAEDETIKGMWCVPRYSNPTGITYSDEVVERLANMRTKANDFRIFWDDAYKVHHLTDTPPTLKSILSACKQAGNPDRVLMFGSTSKITLAGAGVAMMAGSEKNMELVKSRMFFQTIGPDKLNQLRHVRFLKDLAGIENHMKKHTALLKPKFDTVQATLEKELVDTNIAKWSTPKGGYFVSLDTMDDCASRVVEMAAEAGVKLTPAGSTYPYKMDPRNRNIRIAPSFPPIEDVSLAIELVAVCVQLASIDKLMQRRF